MAEDLPNAHVNDTHKALNNILRYDIPPGDENSENILPDDTTSQINTQQINPYHFILGHIDMANGTPPSESSQNSSWEYTYFVPPWMDPNWEDGVERDESAREVHSLIDRGRPALLIKDQEQNPTRYAERLGIFPGRADGRSRMSPTRSESRFLFGEGRPGTKAATEVDQVYMQGYEELLADEHWQSNLFRDMAMDEMHAEDVFTMGGAKSNLRGDLNPLLVRGRWANTSKAGDRADNPRVLYNINGEKAEFDPRRNDRVWEALQPALQLATRLLQVDDPFIPALQDFTNRFIDPSIDARTKMEQEAYPELKFKRKENTKNWWDSILGPAGLLRATKGYSPTAESWRVLKEVLELNIRAGHYDAEGNFAEIALLGLTSYPESDGPGAPIRVHVAAELVWPLLVDKYSESEKMMTSFVLATTLVHELMHAWHAVHHKYLNHLDVFANPKTTNLFACHELRSQMWPKNKWQQEPRFEDEPVHELGHAYEAQVLGGGTWPMQIMSKSNSRPSLMLVSEFPGIICHSRWPEGLRGKPINPKKPRFCFDAYQYYLRVGEVQKYFREDFWATEVKRYGMAATRNPPMKPHKVFLAPEAAGWRLDTFSDINLGTRENRQWIIDYIEALSKDGSQTLVQYVRSLVAETCQFASMAHRLSDDMETWKDREHNIMKPLLNITMRSLEFKTAEILSVSNISQETKDGQIQLLYIQWRACYGMYHDSGAQDVEEISGGSSQTFASTIGGTAKADYEGALILGFKWLAHILDYERRIQESMVCELYDLPAELFQLYVNSMRSHRDGWVKRVNRLRNVLSEFSQLMEDIGPLPRLTNEWETHAKCLSVAFDNIVDLVSGYGSIVYSNWRDTLTAIPMMRKSRRKPRERWFFLAKKEMLKLSGPDLGRMTEFRHRFKELVNSDNYKITLPEGVNEQDMSQLWEWVLGTLKPSGSTVDFMAERNILGRTGLQQLAQQEAARTATMPPQLTRPDVESHPVPLGRFLGPRLRQANQPVSDGSSPNPFPANVPDNPDTAGTSTLAAHIHKPFCNRKIPATGVMPVSYTIRKTIPKDLQVMASGGLAAQEEYIYGRLDSPSIDERQPEDGNPAIGRGHRAVASGPVGDYEDDDALVQMQRLDQSYSERSSGDGAEIESVEDAAFNVKLGTKRQGERMRKRSKRVKFV